MPVTHQHSVVLPRFILARFVPPQFVLARSRRPAFSLVLLTILALSTASSCVAQPPDAKADQDTITFANGDRLTGKVLSEAGGKVVFHSDVAGDITVAWEKIQELRTGGKFAVVSQGQRLKLGRPAPEVPVGSLTTSQEQVSVSTTGGEVKNIPLKSAAFIVPADQFQQTLLHQPGLLHGWTGALTLGVTLVQATQTSQTFTGALSLARLVPGADWLDPRNRTTFNATANYGLLREPFIPGVQSASTAKSEILHGDIERDEYFTRRYYFLADASADHNLGSGLNVQQDYGAGAGATLIERPTRTFDVKGDIHYEKQDFYPSGGFPRGRTENLVGASIGESLLQKLPRGLVFTESGVVQPAFNVPSAFTAQAIAALAFPVYKQLAFSLTSQDNFLNNPPSGYKKNTFQFTAGLTYTLK